MLRDLSVLWVLRVLRVLRVRSTDILQRNELVKQLKMTFPLDWDKGTLKRSRWEAVCEKHLHCTLKFIKHQFWRASPADLWLQPAPVLGFY